ncbi:MAG: hypothetical protein AAF492_32115, partial [Verrucomicrobiota bacterium]
PITGNRVEVLLMKASKGEIKHPAVYNPTAQAKKKKDGGWKAMTKNPEVSVDLAHLPGRRIPDSLSAIAMKALSKDQEARYDSVQLLQKDIEAFQGGFATSAEEAGLLKLMQLFFRRHKVATFTLLTIFSLVVGFLIKVTHSERKAQAALIMVQQVSSQAAPEFVNKTRDQLEANDPEAAYASMETALALDPDLDAAWFEKGRLLLDRLDLEGATDALETSIAKSDDDDLRQRALRLKEIAADYVKIAEGNQDKGTLLNDQIQPFAQQVDEVGDHVLSSRLFERAGDAQLGMQKRLLAMIEEIEQLNDVRFTRSREFETGLSYFYWHHVFKEDGLHIAQWPKGVEEEQDRKS